MRRGRRPATFALLLCCALTAVACGGHAGGSAKDVPLSYRPGVDLAVQRSGSSTEGALRVQQLEYTSVDGTRVPALFAVPTGERPLGCLVFVPGFGSPKEAVPELRQGLALLRLATFSIDARNVGARGAPEQAATAVSTPEGVRKMLLDTVTDLRVGLDWLEKRPECRSNIAVLGTSFGGAVATHLAAQDHRIKAAVVTSVGATFKQAILIQPSAAKSIPDLPNYVAKAAEDPALLQHAVDVLGPYDLDRWIGKIAPRPVMIINGRFDPLVAPADALQIAAAARSPKTVLYFNGDHNPFAQGPDSDEVNVETSKFLIDNLHLPVPTA